MVGGRIIFHIIFTLICSEKLSLWHQAVLERAALQHSSSEDGQKQDVDIKRSRSCWALAAQMFKFVPKYQFISTDCDNTVEYDKTRL